jgi:hypothetical protein
VEGCKKLFARLITFFEDSVGLCSDIYISALPGEKFFLFFDLFRRICGALQGYFIFLLAWRKNNLCKPGCGEGIFSLTVPGFFLSFSIFCSKKICGALQGFYIPARLKKKL